MTLLSNIKGTKVILASASPRRSFLLSELMIPHEVQKFDFDEELSKDITPKEVALEIAKKKASQISRKKDIIYITADTVVINNEKVFGKPNNKEEAFTTLKELSGNTHYVTSGVTISYNENLISFCETSEVTFRTLSTEDLHFYIENFKPFDKAGSYGIQDWIGMIGIKEIKGCYYNIMGLPTARLYAELKKI